MQQAEHYLKIGSAHLVKANYPAAMSAFLKANKLDPNQPVVHHNLGLTYFARKKYVLAEQHLNRALELNPNFTDANISLGKIFIKIGLYDKAIEQLNIANSDLTYPSPQKPLFNLGLAYFKKRNYEQSKEYFKEYLKLDKGNCTAYNFYGRSLFFLKKYSVSAQLFDQARKICVKSPNEDYLYYSAISYFYAHRREDSAQRLELFLDKFPKSDYASHVRTLLKELR